MFIDHVSRHVSGNVDDQLIHYQLVDMINQMKKRMHKFPSINYWKRRDSYHCHLLGNLNEMLLCNQKQTWETI